MEASTSRFLYFLIYLLLTPNSRKACFSSFVKESLTLISSQLTHPKPCPINYHSSFLNLLISSGSLVVVSKHGQISPSPNKQINKSCFNAFSGYYF